MPLLQTMEPVMQRSISKNFFGLLSLLFVSLTAHAVIDYKGESLLGIGRLDVDNIRIDGNTISSQNTNGHVVISPNGTGLLEYTPGSANNVLALDGSKRLVSTSTTATTLGYLDISSSLTTQLGLKAPLASPTFTGTFTGPWSTAGPLITSAGGVVTSEAQLAGTRGGSGVSNAGTFTWGANNITLTTSGATGVTLPTSGTLSTLAGVETFTDKTLTAPIIDTVVLDGQASSPANPSAGFYKLYVKDDGKAYKLNSAGVETEIGAGSGGSGGINYITNPDAVSDTTGWTTYDDAAAAPVDMSGGTVTTTFTRTTASGEVIRQNSIASGSFKFSKDAADRQGEGVMTLLDLDRFDAFAATRQYVSIDYETSADFDTDDVCFYVYGTDSTTVTKLQSENGGCLRAAPDGGRFVGWFESNNVDVDFRLGMHIATTNASAYDVFIDNIRAGPDKIVPGAIITEWVPYTPTTQGLGTISSISVLSRRVGDTLEVQGGIGCGTTTGDEVRMGIGYNGTADNVTIDGSKVALSRLVGNAIVGFAEAGHNSVIAPGSNTTYVNLGRGNATTNPAAAAVGTTICSSGHDLQFYFKVPILGWKSNAMMGTADMPYQIVRASYATASGQSMPDATTTIINYTTVDTSAAVGDPFSAVTVGASWKFTAPRAAEYIVHARGYLAASAGWAASEQATLAVWKNGSIYRNLDVHTAESSTSQEVTVEGSTKVYLAKGEYIDIRLYQESGGAIALSAATTKNWVDITEAPNFSAFQNYATVEKQYTCTASGPGGWSTVKCVAVPYMTANGAWRVKLNVAGTLTASGSAAVQITGLTFRNDGAQQACAVGDNNAAQLAHYSRANPNANTVTSSFNGNVTSITFSCDVELESKPTFVP
jgi:hypothetical protein